MEKKISIIIPVYNVELYVEKCLRSCANQDLLSEEYEIIVINDGSKDNSLDIVKRVIVDYSNFVVLDKVNGGVSSARNEGLKIAKGKYIWFIDSDDWIETNCLNKIFSILENDKLDALQISYNIVTKNKINPIEFNTTPVLTPQNLVRPDVFMGVAFTIFRREIQAENNIMFDNTMVSGEDQIFFLSIFKFSKNVKRENLLVYYYLKPYLTPARKVTEEVIYETITKIKEFKYRFEFEEYCKYFIFKQYIGLLDKSKNPKKLHKEFKNNNFINEIDSNKLLINNRIKFLLYKYFGLLFISTYFIFRKIKKN